MATVANEANTPPAGVAAPAGENYLKTKGKPLLKNGYSIIPITVGKKYPVGMGAWQQVQSTEKQLAGWLNNQTYQGVGVLTKYTPAVDIDINDGQIVARMVEFVQDEIGISLQRVGQSPKVLLPYRTDEPFKKITSPVYQSPDGKKHKVEILGDGQQFVAHAIHPDTGKSYRWITEKSLVDVPQQELPPITEAQARSVVEHFKSIVPDDWEIEKNQRSRSAKARNEPDSILENIKPQLDIDEGQIKAALAVICADDYDIWIIVGMALYHQFEGSDDGFKLWDEWGATSPKYQPGETRKKWSTFESDFNSTLSY